MLTLFTVPRAFHGHIAVIQRNAIRSWLRLGPACEVVLFGDDPGTAEIAAELQIRHLPTVKRNSYGTPLLNDLFASAEKIATYPLLCYVNADIILMPDFLQAVRRVIEVQPRCLMICRRWDVDLRAELDFREGWEGPLSTSVGQTGRRRPHTAIDLFVFPRGLWVGMPPLALGRSAWDNWLVYGARVSPAPVVDLSEAVMAVHQNHDYAHQPHGVRDEADVWSTEEARQNLTMAGGYARAFSAYDATHVLTQRGVRRTVTPYHLYRKLALLSVSRPPLRRLVDLMRRAAQRYPVVRRLFLWRINS